MSKTQQHQKEQKDHQEPNQELDKQVQLYEEILEITSSLPHNTLPRVQAASQQDQLPKVSLVRNQ